MIWASNRIAAVRGDRNLAHPEREVNSGAAVALSLHSRTTRLQCFRGPHGISPPRRQWSPNGAFAVCFKFCVCSKRKGGPVVASITNGYSKDHNGRPFRRRVPTPAIIAAAILAAFGVLVWSVALTGGETSRVPVNCNQPSAAVADASTAPNAAPAPSAPKLTAMNRNDMIEVAPAALATFGVRVLNASNQRGKAQSVSDELINQGFSPTQDSAVGDDLLYPNRDLNCVGQIRFGQAGKASAAALWLAVPCAQLVLDERAGTDVDLALGEHFTGTEQSPDAQAALESLRSADPRNPKTGVDPALIRAVHDSTC